MFVSYVAWLMPPYVTSRDGEVVEVVSWELELESAWKLWNASVIKRADQLIDLSLHFGLKTISTLGTMRQQRQQSVRQPQTFWQLGPIHARNLELVLPAQGMTDEFDMLVEDVTAGQFPIVPASRFRKEGSWPCLARSFVQNWAKNMPGKMQGYYAQYDSGISPERNC